MMNRFIGAEPCSGQDGRTLEVILATSSKGVGLTGQFPFRLAQTLPPLPPAGAAQVCGVGLSANLGPFPSATLAAPYAYTVPEAEGRQVL